MKQYTVDAFTSRVFSGNPAAVCVMEGYPPDEVLLDIARENNLSETAFAVRESGGYRLRWFTPGGEIDLCGHATLATAFVLLNFYEPGTERVVFSTMSGELTVTRRGGLYEMDFPSYELRRVPVTEEMAAAFGASPAEAYMGRDLLCVFDDERTVREMAPNMDRLRDLPGLLQHATARGAGTDCVSRSFAPKLSVQEDPVCGSGHCHIVPYWAARLGRTDITAYQASRRGGTLYCRDCGRRIAIAGEAVLFAESELHI